MIWDYLVATWAHLLSALFLGLVPVASIAIAAGLAVGIGAALARRSDAWALFRFAIFFGLVGAALGLMLGASREPAVKAVLPGIVTVLAGLFAYVFPRAAGAGFRIMSEEEDSDPTFVRSFVIAGIAALMIGATMGSFWGGSVRGIAEEDAKRYAEWKAEYETVELPLRLEILRRDLNLPPAEDAK